jgi:hypothetical protein
MQALQPGNYRRTCGRGFGNVRYDGGKRPIKEAPTCAGAHAASDDPKGVRVSRTGTASVRWTRRPYQRCAKSSVQQVVNDKMPAPLGAAKGGLGGSARGRCTATIGDSPYRPASAMRQCGNAAMSGRPKHLSVMSGQELKCFERLSARGSADATSSLIARLMRTPGLSLSKLGAIKRSIARVCLAAAFGTDRRSQLAGHRLDRGEHLPARGLRRGRLETDRSHRSGGLSRRCLDAYIRKPQTWLPRE